MTFLVMSLIMLLSVPDSLAEEGFDSSGKVRLEGSLLLGIGFDDVDLGVTTDGDTISLSGGGGVGFTLGLGYGLSSNIDLDLHLGSQASSLKPSVSNADGEFTRTMLLGTLKYRKTLTSSNYLKFGAGLGIYTGGEWDVDASLVPGGAHNVIEYKDALGVHATFEYEHVNHRNIGLAVGLRLYIVEYSAETASSNGVSVPASFLMDEVRNLDGSGMDLTMSISKYF